MSKRPFRTKPLVSDICKSENIFANWLIVIGNFYECYHQLRACINQGSMEEKSNTLYVGQCPTSHLMQLVISMQEELEKLAQDIDQPGELNATEGYDRLLTHTQLLDNLNQQAYKALNLASQIAN